jgi:hypothetical protein
MGRVLQVGWLGRNSCVATSGVCPAKSKPTNKALYQ